MDYIKFDLLSIDAWRYDYGWTWNNAYYIERDIVIAETELTPRKLCRYLRNIGVLSDQSKGLVRVDMHPESMSYQIEFCDKRTGEPVFALQESFNYGSDNNA